MVTIPNNYLILKPVKVIHSKGTIISSEVSLGYDIPWEQVRKLLILAAENSGLEDPFVHTITLGDFSIGYRVSGLLSEVKYLITAKSQLNNEILATLHKNAIEIVSPNFMNTRVVNDITFIPVKTLKKEAQSTEELPEETIFEKADMAEKIEADTQHLSDLQDKIKELKKLMDSSFWHRDLSPVPPEANENEIQHQLNKIKIAVKKDFVSLCFLIVTLY